MRQEEGIVTNHAANGQIVGMGSVIAPQKILTCAHVVNSALARPAESDLKPLGKILVGFPLHLGVERVYGTVEDWYAMNPTPTNPDAPVDVAIIALEKPVAACVGIAEFCSHTNGHVVRSYGFRSRRTEGVTTVHHPNGEWVEGIVLGTVAGNQVQVDGVRETGIFLQPGFSGAGVFDLKYSCNVGVVVTANLDVSERIGRMIPNIVLRAMPGFAQVREGDSSFRSIRHLIGEGTSVDAKALREEVGKYLKWAHERYGTIELRGVRRAGGSVVHLDLEHVYVPLEAVAYVPHSGGRGQHEGPQARAIQLNELLDIGPRVILTGGPGSGKTTVLLHIIRTLSVSLEVGAPEVARESLGISTDLPFPVFVPLSAYAAHLRRSDQASNPASPTLAGFIADYLRRHHSSFDLPKEFFDHMLRNGRNVILLLDGLDEVPNEAERTRVRQAVEELVTGRPEMRVVVTCRTAAYNGRTALGRDFREVRVKPLDEEHVTKLVSQAYGHLYQDSPTLKEEKIRALLTAVHEIEEERQIRLGTEVTRLFDSPLLVRLLLIVHCNNEDVPKKRAELYMMATEAMLLPDYGPDEEVMEAIGRTVGGSREAHRNLVQYLAFQMHSQGRELGREIDEYALRRFILTDEAFSPLCDEFISSTRLRGTLMEERFGQYRFIHLAFQEFLVGRYLIERLCMRKGLSALVDFLETGPLIDSWWRESILLAIGYLAITSPVIGEAFVRSLASLGSDPASRLNLSADLQMAGAEFAAIGLLDWGTARAETYLAVQNRLLSFFVDADESLIANAKPALRAAAGAALGRLGDTRREVTGLDTLEFCFVPAGPFRIGSNAQVEGASPDRLQSLATERPEQEFNLDYDFWLGRYPVTNAQFAEFVRDDGYRDPSFWSEAAANEVWRPGEILRWYWDGPALKHSWESEPYDYGQPFNLANHPAVGLCWYEALAFMRWLEQRWKRKEMLADGWTLCFPSEPEWEKAARGGLLSPEKPRITCASSIGQAPHDYELRQNPNPRRRYPWGDDLSVGFANVRETGLRSTNAPGCFPQSVSPFGCEEMCGNTWEWTRTLWGRQRVGTHGEELEWDFMYTYPYDSGDGRADLAADGYWLRVPRGGAYITESSYSRCSFRDYGSPSFRFPWDGFRIAAIPIHIISHSRAIVR